ncbi:NADPH-dependent FMN reductase [Nocardiopsis synnemataformans]|uniref:NADPH-dependent FMN reductase n=1 Tax=Nocardiopsis synnemataformans TaxID=61305 RepID=UPI003EBCBD47
MSADTTASAAATVPTTASGDAPVRVCVIVGSTREGRFGPTAAAWFQDRARQYDGVETDVVDLAEDRLPDRLVEGELPAAVAALAPRLAAADAFVVVTPEYNHSFPAPLKTAIDWFVGEWRAKPVGFVSYGGVSGGLRAVEQLRQVFAELRAVTVRDSVSFADFWDRFDADGGWPSEPKAAEGAAAGMLDELTWWARALRAHREAVPYPS